MTWSSPALALLALLALPSTDEHLPATAYWHPQPLDGLYARVAEDLRQGLPLVVVSHYGMWYTRQENPERNLNWGVRDGHYTVVRKARRNVHAGKIFRHRDWRRVYYSAGDSDPIRVAVFRQKVRPGKRWQALKVEEAFEVYLVMLAYPIRERAGVAMARQLFLGEGMDLKLDNGTVLDTGTAQVVGYMGHNFFFDYEDFDYPEITTLRRPLARPTGLFAIGCKTGEVPGFLNLLDANVHVVLFTHDYMAVEGPATLALMDGLSRGLSGRRLARLADKAYR